jgi:hypothetical protein
MKPVVQFGQRVFIFVITVQPSAPRPPILGVTNGYSPKIGGRGLNRYFRCNYTATYRKGTGRVEANVASLERILLIYLELITIQLEE